MEQLHKTDRTDFTTVTFVGYKRLLLSFRSHTLLKIDMKHGISCELKNKQTSNAVYLKTKKETHNLIFKTQWLFALENNFTTAIAFLSSGEV